jgi:methionyl aminopeptidase
MIDHNVISTKTPEEIAMMREAGKICAQILSDLTPHVKPGVTLQQINDIAYDLIVNKYDAQVDREDLSGYDASEYACISIAHNEIAF